MKENDELLEEDLEFILGGTPIELDKEINLKDSLSYAV